MRKQSPIIAVKTQQSTSVYSAIGLGVGVTAVVAVFIVIGVAIFSTLSVVPAAAPLDDTSTVTLTWTAPGDDGNIGQATAYDLRYYGNPITRANWSKATKIRGLNRPKPAGSAEGLIVKNLNPATTYFFAIRAVDENKNWSNVSNVASHTTGCNPNWSCTDWSECIDSQQSRRCIDKNICGDNTTRPKLNRSCTVDPGDDEPPVGGCNTDWRCSTWSSCVDSKIYRRCVDRNFCDLTADRPVVSKSCSASICEENWWCGEWSGCNNGKRIRSCTNLNNCNATLYKPETEMGCLATPLLPPQESVIVTGAAAGGGPHVRIFRTNGEFLSQFFAYDPRFKNGIIVAAGDVDGDGHIEIVTGTGPNSAPHVRIFTIGGKLKGQFFAYESFLRTGVDVAVADINNDGKEEIITSPLSNGGPHIRVFRKDGRNYKVVDQFFAYSPYFRGGVGVTADDLNGDGRAEIVTVPHTRGGPHIRVFNRPAGTTNYRLSSQFFAFPENWRLGLDVAIVNSDGPLDPRILVSVSAGGGPHLRLFTPGGRLVDQFFAASQSFRGGVVVSSTDVDQDGWDEILTGAYSNGLPGVFTFSYVPGIKEWKLINQFYAYHPSFSGGIKLYSPH
ncbi:FG-GAP-like repeat-containing protein [Patescibacteria group bacterium]